MNGIKNGPGLTKVAKGSNKDGHEPRKAYLPSCKVKKLYIFQFVIFLK